jgi:hypothetical protein
MTETKHGVSPAAAALKDIRDANALRREELSKIQADKAEIECRRTTAS